MASQLLILGIVGISFLCLIVLTMLFCFMYFSKQSFRSNQQTLQYNRQTQQFLGESLFKMSQSRNDIERGPEKNRPLPPIPPMSRLSTQENIVMQLQAAPSQPGIPIRAGVPAEAPRRFDIYPQGQDTSQVNQDIPRSRGISLQRDSTQRLGSSKFREAPDFEEERISDAGSPEHLPDVYTAQKGLHINVPRVRNSRDTHRRRIQSTPKSPDTPNHPALRSVFESTSEDTSTPVVPAPQAVAYAKV